LNNFHNNFLVFAWAVLLPVVS